MTESEMIREAAKMPATIECNGVFRKSFNCDEGIAWIFEAKDEHLHEISVTLEVHENIRIVEEDGYTSVALKFIVCEKQNN